MFKLDETLSNLVWCKVPSSMEEQLKLDDLLDSFQLKSFYATLI